jgi:FkbM family methyltransferase
MNRLLSRPIARALERSPALRLLASGAIDSHRLELELMRLQRRGLVIRTVYDIGAHQGAWTEKIKRLLPNATFFLFEANDVHADALGRTGAKYFTVILSAAEQEVEFFGKGTSGDSYLRELTERYESVTPEVRHARTLDGLIAEHGIPPPDLLKVDVQGAELDVLRGGEEALGHAKLVLLECPIVPYNLGAPTIDEYFRYMDEHGFTVLKFVVELWPDERMRHVDIIFGSLDEPSVTARE